jgi:hypothetical protein
MARMTRVMTFLGLLCASLFSGLAREAGADVGVPPVPRILVKDVELRQASFKAEYLPGNRLIIRATFKNVSCHLFQQPFTFRVNAATRNIISSAEPVVRNADLGGDGVLRPGETTAELAFEVIHRGKPFAYFVDAYAVAAPALHILQIDQKECNPDNLIIRREVVTYTVKAFDASGNDITSYVKFKWSTLRVRRGGNEGAIVEQLGEGTTKTVRWEMLVASGVQQAHLPMHAEIIVETINCEPRVAYALQLEVWDPHALAPGASIGSCKG